MAGLLDALKTVIQLTIWVVGCGLIAAAIGVAVDHWTERRQDNDGEAD